MDVKEDTTVTPEPGAETEIEIAAGAGGDGGETTKSVSDSGSESSRSREGPQTHSALTQKLAGILGGPRPGSGLGSRKDSGSSTPAKSEALEYLCASFVQSTSTTGGGRNNNKTDSENKMSIICHYNPIMDEYNR